MNERPRDVSVSNDVLGGFGDQTRLAHVVPREFGIKRVEALAIGDANRVLKSIQKLEDIGFKVARIHGRMGIGNEKGLDRLFVASLNSQLVSTGLLMHIFGKNMLGDREILLHEPEARSIKYIPLMMWQKRPRLFFENHNEGLESIKSTIKQAERFRLAGFETGVVMDVFHVTRLGESRKDFQKKWDAMISFVASETSNPRSLLRKIHFPVGTRVKDSLPIDSRIDSSMLVNFRKALGPSVDEIELENQQEGHLAYLPKREEEKVLKRNYRIFSLLGKAGFFDRMPR